MNEKAIKIAIVISLVLLAIIIPSMCVFEFNLEAKRLYAQGMEYYTKKDYSNAYYNFKQVKKYSDFYNFALLKQFQCANNLQDKKTAKEVLTKLTKITKDENIRPYVLYNDAVLSQEMNLESETKLLAKYKYIFEKYKENDFSYAASYQFAKLIEKTDKYLAKERYVVYLSYAPAGKYAKDVLSKIQDFEHLFLKEDLIIIADAYFENKDYQNALLYYQKDGIGKNWVKISKCYKNLKNIQEELKTIENGLSLANSPIEEKEISYAIDRLIAIKHLNKINALQEMYTFYPKYSYIIPTVEYKLAESLTSVRAIKFYEDIVKNYNSSIWAPNAMWELVWYNYKQKHYRTCERYYEIYFEKFKNSTDAPRISYWYAKALLNDKKSLKAKEMFYKVIEDYPLSYYAFLSARQLKLSKLRRIITNKSITKYNINNINKDLFKNSSLFVLADYDDWQTIEDLKINDEYIKSWILYKKGLYPLSITTAKNEYTKSEKQSINDWQVKLMYPVLYEDLINTKAKLYNRSPYLFLSLIREESHFNKNAVSSVGALGLSQIMPTTADFISKTKVAKGDLLDEEKNIDIGLKYYTYLVDFFDGNEFLAIMSYNAGPGNINKWLKSPITDTGEIDMFIENVPFMETKTYIKKILSSYWVYINIYSNKYI